MARVQALLVWLAVGISPVVEVVLVYPDTWPLVLIPYPLVYLAIVAKGFAQEARWARDFRLPPRPPARLMPAAQEEQSGCETCSRAPAYSDDRDAADTG